MPRYEFRIFRQNLSNIEVKLQNYLPPGETVDSSELYIVSVATNETNVKIRDDVLDIKVLLQRWSGLEQWQPVLKAGFPLPADLLVQEFFPRVGVETPQLERSHYSFDEFLRELIQPQTGLFVAQVAKLRQKLIVENCQAELSDVIIEGEPWRSVAFESEDPQTVLRAQHVLGLDSHQNISYVKAIKQVLALGPVSD